MEGMFAGSSSLTGLDLSNFNTSKVTDMHSMFRECDFDTSNVTDMGAMFNSCENLTDLNISSFNTSKVENMYCMFKNTPKLTTLTISNTTWCNTAPSQDSHEGTMFYNSAVPEASRPSWY